MSRHRRKLTELSKDVINYFVEKSHLTQQRIAGILEVDKSFVSRLRAGERELSTTHLEALADHLGVPVGVMLIEATRSEKPVSPEIKRLKELCEKLILKTDRITETLRERRPSKKAS